jgi:hypothetical protein
MDGVLDVALPDSTELAFVRIQLPTVEYLHIHSVGLVDSGRRYIGAATVGLSASSHRGESEKWLLRKELLNPSNKLHNAVHTLKESKPWVQLSLVRPMNLTRIKLQNRKRSWAIRARGIMISGSADGIKWQLLYDQQQRLQQLYAEALEQLGGALSEDVVSFICDVLTYNYRAAEKEFMHMRLEDDVRQDIVNGLNEIVMPARSLEWTGHGARMSFRYWTFDDKVEYVKTASTLVRDLQAVGEDACLGFGSVLGVVREADLIAHDDDMDVVVAFPRGTARTLGAAKKIVQEFLELHGYQVRKIFFSHLHVWRGRFKIDVFVGIYDEGKRIGWYPGKRAALRRSEMFPAREIDLLGVNCLVPADPERYLAVIYGVDWRSPDPRWKYKWDHSEYADIA